MLYYYIMKTKLFSLSKSPYSTLIVIGVVVLIIAVYNSYSNKRVESFSSNDDVGVKMFYVDWCGHCKTAKPGYKQFMDEYHGTKLNDKTVQVEMINCEENEENAKMASEYEVKGYPTIIAGVNGQKHVYAGSDKSSQGFSSWLKSLL
jgi:thiol-disulfide isomerase/thioredoxin